MNELKLPFRERAEQAASEFNPELRRAFVIGAEWAQRQTEQAQGRVEITDAMVDRAIGGMEVDGKGLYVAAFDQDLTDADMRAAMRAALKAALNVPKCSICNDDPGRFGDCGCVCGTKRAQDSIQEIASARAARKQEDNAKGEPVDWLEEVDSVLAEYDHGERGVRQTLVVLGALCLAGIERLDGGAQ